MSEIQTLHSITLGYYVVAEVNSYKLYCSTTLFPDRARADWWRDRWQKRLVAYIVSVEEIKQEMEVKR
jgi:hypothetical protein